MAEDKLVLIVSHRAFVGPSRDTELSKFYITHLLDPGDIGVVDDICPEVIQPGLTGKTCPRC